MAHRWPCPKCGSSTALGDYRCFKCGYIQAQFTTKELYLKPPTTELVLPDKIELNPHKFHIDALKWLGKSYVFNEIIIKQGIGYVPDTHRVFIPYYKNRELQFYQTRNLQQWGIKYITGGKSRAFEYRDHKTDTVYIVEDHLSAMRLRKHCNVICLSSTSMNSDLCSSILDRYTKVVFWLDPDRPGRLATFKNIKLMKNIYRKRQIKQLFSSGEEKECSVLYVNYAKLTSDPKYYSDTDIGDILKNGDYSCGETKDY